MAADVVEAVQRAGSVADHDDALAGDRGHEIDTRFRGVLFSPDAHPGPREPGRLLVREDGRVVEDLRRQEVGPFHRAPDRRDIGGADG